LKVEVSGYFNSLLFPLAVAQRFAHHLLRRDAPLDARPAPLLNAALQRVSAAARLPDASQASTKLNLLQYRINMNDLEVMCRYHTDCEKETG